MSNLSLYVILYLMHHCRITNASHNPFPIFQIKSVLAYSRNRDDGSCATGIYSKCEFPIGLKEIVANFTKNATDQRLFGKHIHSGYLEKWYLFVVKGEMDVIWLMITMIRETYEIMFIGQFVANKADIFAKNLIWIY